MFLKNFRTKQLVKVLAFWKISKDWGVFWQNWWFMRVHNLTNFLSFWEPWVTAQNWLFVFMRTTSQGSINLTLACWFLLWKRDRQLPNTGVYLLREVKHTWIDAHNICIHFEYTDTMYFLVLRRHLNPSLSEHETVNWNTHCFLDRWKWIRNEKNIRSKSSGVLMHLFTNNLLSRPAHSFPASFSLLRYL